jgi:hypothetical protein
MESEESTFEGGEESAEEQPGEAGAPEEAGDSTGGGEASEGGEESAAV